MSRAVAQQHLDRLSAIDAAFLHQEGPNTHMHIGGVVTLEAPAPDFRALREHVLHPADRLIVGTEHVGACSSTR